MKRRLLIPLVIAMVSASAHAEDKGYKIVRPDGTVEFTDQPTPGAQEIPLPRTPGYEAPPVRPATPVATPAPKGPVYTQLAIISPAQEQVFQNGETAVTVTLQLEPAMRIGHRLVIFLDGSEVAEGEALSTTINNVERGTHRLSAEVRDSRGNVVQSAAPITFHMRQHSQFFDPPPQNAPPSAVSPAPMMPKAPRMQ